MSYKSLFKLYVMNDIDTFNKIYYDRFNSNSTILFDLKINNNQAFFNYDKFIMMKISKIKELNIIINELIDTLPPIVIEQYKEKCLIEEINQTNSIEGVLSSKIELNDLLSEIEKSNQVKNKFYEIVLKYKMMDDDNISIKTNKDIRGLYDCLLYSLIQEENPTNLPDSKLFRKDKVYVFSGTNKIIHEGIFPKNDIAIYLEKALSILNDLSIDVLVRISVFHYLFGYVHPFYDGNGRINRFITSYYLSKYFNKLMGYRLSNIINDFLSDYMNAFKQTNDIRNKADISTFVDSFLNIISKSFEKTLEEIINKKEKYDIYQTIIEKLIDGNKLEKEILSLLMTSSLFGSFGISKTKLCKLVKRGNTIVTGILVNLKKLGLCKDFKSGRHIYYQANLKILDDLIVKL